jgi:hypothetical protein
MKEIVAGVGGNASDIGPALLSMRWQHRRHHSTRASNLRYWLPPGMSEASRRND